MERSNSTHIPLSYKYESPIDDNKSNWVKQLENYAAELKKWSDAIGNQKKMIDQGIIHLMSMNGQDKNGELYKGMQDFGSVLRSTQDIYKSVNSINRDLQKGIHFESDLIPDPNDFRKLTFDQMLTKMERQEKAWQDALGQAIDISKLASDTETRKKTEQTMKDALDMSSKSQGSLQALQSLAQVNAALGGLINQNNVMVAEQLRIATLEKRLEQSRQQNSNVWVQKNKDDWQKEQEEIFAVGDSKKLEKGDTLSFK